MKPTPTKVWKQVHMDLMKRLRLPCKLRCSNEFSIGGHEFDDRRCYIHVNSKVAFHQPVHLILHEAAHHVFLLPFRLKMEGPFAVCCGEEWGRTGGHCSHWAETLLGMYRKLNIPLPQSTQFPSFAKLAGIQLYTREV